MTKGPCCATGSAMGLPCRMSTSAGVLPVLVNVASAPASIVTRAWFDRRVPSISRLLPATPLLALKMSDSTDSQTCVGGGVEWGVSNA